MKIEYNPFQEKEIIETEYGRINTKHEMGRTYITFRRSEHFFKKYQGFGISNTELQICDNKGVKWILIIYTNTKNEQVPMRIKLSNINKSNKFNYNGDNQTIIKKEDLEIKKEEKWQ